jgi:hypothetical protein
MREADSRRALSAGNGYFVLFVEGNEMPARATCPRCQIAFRLPDPWDGQGVDCPRCGQRFRPARTPPEAIPVTEVAKPDPPIAEAISQSPLRPRPAPQPAGPWRRQPGPGFRHSEESSALPWIIAGVLGGSLLLVVGVVSFLILRLDGAEPVPPEAVPVVEALPEVAPGPGQPRGPQPMEEVKDPERGPPGKQEPVKEPPPGPPIQFTRLPKPAKPLPWKVTDLPGEKVTYKLAAKAVDVAVGGDGRFLILHLRDANQLAIFDTLKAKVVRAIGVAKGEIRFTAGMDRLLVFAGGKLQCWNLLTGQLEKTGLVPVPGRVKALGMGSASNGPLLLGVQDEPDPNQPFVVPPTRWAFLDPQTLRPLPVAGKDPGPFRFRHASVLAGVAADGQVFRLIDEIGGRGRSSWTIVLVGNELRCCQNRTGFGLESNGCLDPVFYTGRPIYFGQVNIPPVVSFMPLNSRTMFMDWYVGAHHGAYRLRQRQTEENQIRKRSLAVLLPGVETPLGSIEGIEEAMPEIWQPEMGPEKRLHLIPSARRIVFLPRGDDCLVLYRFDPAKELARAAASGPVVLSQPPVAAPRGTRLAYQLKVLARGRVGRYRLEDGPPGMSLSAAGLLTWDVPQNQEGRETGALLSVADGAGREAFHGFWLMHPGQAPAQAKPPRHQEFTPLPPPAPFAAPRLARSPSQFVLDAPFTDLVVGGAGRYLVLHQPKLKRLAVFDLGKATVAGTVPLRDNDVSFAAGLEKLIVLYPKDRCLERWNLTTCKREQVALSPPWQGVKNVALGAASRGPLLVYWTEGFEEMDRCGFAFLNPQTLREVPIRWQGLAQNGDFRSAMQVRASADGQVFGLWGTNQFPSGVETMVYARDAVHVHYLHDSTNRVVPGPDGKTIFTSLGQLSQQLKPLGPKPRANAADDCLPAVQGKYFLKVDLGQPGQKSAATVYKAGNPRPLCRVAELDLGPAGMERPRNPIHLDKQICLIPGAKLLVSIPPTNDRLLLHRLDFKD